MEKRICERFNVEGERWRKKWKKATSQKKRIGNGGNIEGAREQIKL